MRVFEAESLLGSILLQVGELFAVDGSTALPEAHDTKRKTSRSHQNSLIITW